MTGGNWSLGSSWVGGIKPGCGDLAIIAPGATVTLSGSNESALGLKIDAGGTLNLPSGNYQHS